MWIPLRRAVIASLADDPQRVLKGVSASIPSPFTRCASLADDPQRVLKGLDHAPRLVGEDGASLADDPQRVLKVASRLGTMEDGKQRFIG